MPGKISRELQLLLTGKDVSWSKTTKGAEKSMSRLHNAGAKAGRNMTRNLERGVVIASAAAVGAGVLAVDQAMSFESSSASVRKTIEGNVDAILAANRELSKTTGLEVNALNEISATGGALGIAKDDIDDFTKTVSMLGQTTDDVTTDMGATSLGHLKTTLNLAGTDFDHVGNTLVALGNDGASTEGQILSMTENIAGAAGIMNASTPQVLGWAAALANTGEEAEAGGSSIQRFWLESFKAVNKGGKELQLMAKISGQTTDQFKKDFGRDATGTLAKFIVQLGELTEAEQLSTLEALGFTDIRITRALLKLTANTDNLTDSLGLAEKGWLENNAGTEEWNKRLETTASKLAILKANVNDAAITIGTELLPVLADLSTDAVKWISEHQGDIRQFSQDLAKGVREAVTWGRQLDWEAIGAGLKIAAGAAGGIVQAFASAPPWVQALLVGGFAANKFTGGAVGDVLKIGFDMFAGRGSSPANPVFVSGMGGDMLGGAGVLGKLGALVRGITIVGITAQAASMIHGPLDELAQEIHNNVIGDDNPLSDFGDAWNDWRQTADWPFGQKNAPEWAYFGGKPPAGEPHGPPTPRGWEHRGSEVFGPPAPSRTGGLSPGERDERLAKIMANARAAHRQPRDPLAAAQNTLLRNLEREEAQARAAIERTNAKIDSAKSSAVVSAMTLHAAEERSATRIVAAIQGIKIPPPSVNVSMTVARLQRAQATQSRYGPANGSRYRVGGPQEFDS